MRLGAHRRVDPLLEQLLHLLGFTPGRSRARRSTDDGSRSGTTAAASTTLFGTMIESSPRANVV